MNVLITLYINQLSAQPILKYDQINYGTNDGNVLRDKDFSNVIYCYFSDETFLIMRCITNKKTSWGSC